MRVWFGSVFALIMVGSLLVILASALQSGWRATLIGFGQIVGTGAVLLGFLGLLVGLGMWLDGVFDE